MTKFKTAKALRAAILAQGDLDFEFYVRFWRDGERWVGASNYGSEARCAELCRRLETLGLRPVMDGKPGTEGRWIIRV